MIMNLQKSDRDILEILLVDIMCNMGKVINFQCITTLAALFYPQASFQAQASSLAIMAHERFKFQMFAPLSQMLSSPHPSHNNLKADYRAER